MRHKLKLIWFVIKTPTERLKMPKTDAAITNLTAAVDGVIAALTAAQTAASQADTLDASSAAEIQAQADRLTAAITPPAAQP